MNWFKEILSSIKAIVLAPLANILAIGGTLLVLASFVEYDKIHGLALYRNVNFTMIGLGLLLVLIGAFTFLFSHRESQIRTKLDYRKGVEIKRGQLNILIKEGEIQTIPNLTSNDSIVLPANTTFVDDCVTDKRSAMGAFFGEHFSAQIAGLPSVLRGVLASNGFQPSTDGQYPPTTTVILPDQFSKPAKVAITAATIRSRATGISSSPFIICGCVEQILRATADERVDAIYLPIIGSGHGGVDRGLALLFLLLGLLHFSKTYFHIKKVRIIVHPKDVKELNESKELRLIIAL